MRITRVTLVIVALAIGVGFYQVLNFLMKDVEVQALQAVEEVMVDSSHLLAGVVEGELESGSSLEDGIKTLERSIAAIGDHEVTSKIYNREKQEVSMGVYVVNRDGIVIYDSENGKRVGIDYSRFNDVKRTFDGRYGARSTRTDEEDDRSSVMYVAAPVMKDGEVVASLSVYKKQEDVREFVEARGKVIVFSTLQIGFGVMLLCVAVLFWVYRPIGILTRYAKSVAAGERLPIPKLGKGYEVNTLGKALYQMRETLEGRNYVENYVRSLTHELKSPLAGIRGAAEILEEPNVPAEKRIEFLKNIQKEVSRSEMLVSELLCLSQLEGMQFLKEKEVLSVRSLVDDVAEEVKNEADEREVHVEVKASDDLEIEGDRKVLSLALLHLVRNAIEFSEKEGVVELSWGRESKASTLDGKDSVVVYVRDSGVGMPGYAVERVMEHFYSLPRPDGVTKSTGLGLPLVKEAMALHGGAVTLKNRENARGCKATLYFPARDE